MKIFPSTAALKSQTIFIFCALMPPRMLLVKVKKNNEVISCSFYIYYRNKFYCVNTFMSYTNVHCNASCCHPLIMLSWSWCFLNAFLIMLLLNEFQIFVKLFLKLLFLSFFLHFSFWHAGRHCQRLRRDICIYRSQMCSHSVGTLGTIRDWDKSHSRVIPWRHFHSHLKGQYRIMTWTDALNINVMACDLQLHTAPWEHPATFTTQALCSTLNTS